MEFHTRAILRDNDSTDLVVIDEYEVRIQICLPFVPPNHQLDPSQLRPIPLSVKRSIAMANSLQLSQRFMFVCGVAARDRDGFDFVLPQPMARGYADITP